MVRIAIDAMGGDNAPGEIVRGAVEALSRDQGLKIILVGLEKMIKPLLPGEGIPGNRIEVVHAPEVITGDDTPGISIRRKKGASMVMALEMVRGGDADAILSAGNTGALMAGGLIFLGRIPGVSRPALLTTFPVFDGEPAVILDVGANMDARPEQMLQYAFMGSAYARQVLKRKNPKISLLNVGVENNKGNEQVKKTYELFASHVENFAGNIEPYGIFEGNTDVVVCDGFVGNIFLKTAEGISRGIFEGLKEQFMQNMASENEARALFSSFNAFRLKMDDVEYGGAPLIGVKGICIKCHGSSGRRAIMMAIKNQVIPSVKNRVNDVIEESIAGLKIDWKGF